MQKTIVKATEHRARLLNAIKDLQRKDAITESMERVLGDDPELMIVRATISEAERVLSIAHHAMAAHSVGLSPSVEVSEAVNTAFYQVLEVNRAIEKIAKDTGVAPVAEVST